MNLNFRILPHKSFVFVSGSQKVCVPVCTYLCAPPPQPPAPHCHCHYQESSVSTLAARQAPEAMVAHKTETCETQCGESSTEIFANTICICLCTENVFLTQPVTFYYVSSATTIHTAPCSTFYPCAPDLSSPFERLFGLSPGLHYPLLPLHCIPSTPHCWLLFPHHSVWRRLPRFCPIRSHSQSDSQLALDSPEPSAGWLLFISPVIGVRKILVFEDRITCHQTE